MSTSAPDRACRNTPSESAWWLGARPESRLGSWWRGAGGGRQGPQLLVGVVLVLGSVLGVLVWSAQVGQREEVLALARAVSVGQVLAAHDLRPVRIAAGPEVATVPVSETSKVVGQPVVTSLPAGSLLSPQLVGSAPLVPAGQAVASVALRPGAFPREVAPGAAVLVVSAQTSSAAGGSAGVPPAAEAVAVWPATVVSVTGGDHQEATTVVSVQLAETAARQVAAVPAGQVALVLVPGGER